jgi:DNA-binding GntR family transcriptional regulator
MAKKLLPGEKIPELKISKELNISRTPVRSALQKLSGEGLIIIKPNSFARVAVFDEKTVQDIGILRVAIDVMAVKLASLYGSRADFLRLKEIAEKCLKYAEAKKYRKRFDYDMKFHKELARISKNKMLLKIQNDLHKKVEFIIMHNPSSIGKQDIPFLTEHLKLVDALMKNKTDAAVKIISNHLSAFYHLDQKLPSGFLM